MRLMRPDSKKTMGAASLRAVGLEVSGCSCEEDVSGQCMSCRRTAWRMRVSVSNIRPVRVHCLRKRLKLAQGSAPELSDDFDRFGYTFDRFGYIYYYSNNNN